MAKPNLILLSLLTFSLFSLSYPLPSIAVLNAEEILSNSGFVAMALTLDLVSATLTSQPPSATIFSPSDAAFSYSGQPPLSLLQFHFSPLAFSLDSLRSLPYGTKIPTLSSGKSLIVTTSALDQQVSLNNVTINGSPIYDDGSLIIFGIDKFFDPNLEVVLLPIQSPSPDLRCVASTTTTRTTWSYLSRGYSFDEASGMLRSRGYSVVASFLDLQLVLALVDRPNLTVFAPVDDVMLEYVGNVSEYSSLFLRHVVPCKLRWTDLINFEDGTELRTFSDGFTVKITKNNDLLMINGVPISIPDMFDSDWLSVHGLHKVLEMPETPVVQEDESPSSEFGEEWIAPDRSEF
ncbi:putative fasciclin-like arabinogalactan protein 20 [Camellia sinensis]|uniref:FAS1 domain-containing protein n=1 Tax=Camellia sinensis var. sinensis TaxID=542762 RepID=A0A4S4E3N1_CAMSN|nr:putative fasciclin-like arabinogalactan protein 20 [Camellia sinensis]THG10519.1 hypothetical protein TEA_015466 [Camellia sinensis var. sinensis]